MMAQRQLRGQCTNSDVDKSSHSRWNINGTDKLSNSIEFGYFKNQTAQIILEQVRACAWLLKSVLQKVWETQQSTVWLKKVTKIGLIWTQPY